MIRNSKFRVGYLERPMHPDFLTAIEAAQTCELVQLKLADGIDEIIRELSECDGYYVRASRDELPLPLHLGQELLDKLPNLKVAATYGAGYDTIDVPACSSAGVAVCNQAGGNAEAVAEHALAFMLAILKRIPECSAAIGSGTAADRSAFMGRELHGRTVGIVGLGHVGTRTAAYMRAFDCNVLAYDPNIDAETAQERGAEKVELDDLLARSDILSLHCPLTSETRGMIGTEALAKLPKGAVLVTTARGSIHDEDAVLAALQSGHLSGAGLDVWEKEPPAADHPLYRHPLVISTNHAAGVTGESRARVARMAAEVFCEAGAGRVPPRLLNPEIAERVAAALKDSAAARV
ncbi:hypothetical protein ATO6_16445 [Oceanicola sp. 22II-s10i]|uniref:NAD(P)-dependent oxidoreductase n=1 Tax=Oceanicola sp. 22II-s10i TaxID=1317116 RepID=UPI000B6CA88D|nr:hydroxyacid dehydrogenase [Oceanicola sp. 22II-s10i]OWU83989.1 hypothetical protein ATO6_16445 [Oceanicola sp. 22II-s10i]